MSKENPKLLVKEKIKESVNIWKWSAIAICILAFGSLMYGYAYHRIELKMSNSLRVDAETIAVDLSGELKEANHIADFKTKELDKLKKQIEGIKDKNDLLKRDIEFYIDITQPKVPAVVGKEIAKQVVDLSRKHKMSPELVVGIIKVESAFNPMAVGPKTKYGHARGLMQVMPEWAKKLKVEGLKGQYDFHNINIGIESGIKVFLIHLEEGKGDISTGLYYYVNKDRKYVANVYAAMGKFVAFRSTIDEDNQNVKTDINLNGDSKPLPILKKGEKKVKND